jgi:glycosyltransferase involved in cell wall biosynthesis
MSSLLIDGVLLRRAPKTLLFFLGLRENYRCPLFSKDEIFCSPDVMDESRGGRATAVKCPVGEFDISDFIRSKHGLENPELLIIKIDASLRCCPKNLFKLKCPKVLIVGDTHHMSLPLQRVIRYALSEPFTHIIMDHTRHHAHFMLEAGLKNVHWIPAVDYAYHPRNILANPRYSLTFVGQVGRYHPYRIHVLNALRVAGMPLEVMRGTNSQAADIYSDSRITLNVSLNGDLNLRVFESLAAGGFLLTDRLAPAAGLDTIFEEDKHLVTWGSVNELIEKISYYLNNPELALDIRKKGQAELIINHSPEVKIKQFFDLVFNGKINPRYEIIAERGSVFCSSDTIDGFLNQNIDPYEVIQELHRNSIQTTVWCADPKLLSNLADLPRLDYKAISEVPRKKNNDETWVLWLEGNETELASSIKGRYINNIVVRRPRSDILSAALAEWGYCIKSGCAWHYVLRSPALFLRQSDMAGFTELVGEYLIEAIDESLSPSDCIVCAELAERYLLNPLYLRSTQRAVELDRNHQGALIAASAAALSNGDHGATLLYLEEFSRLASLPLEVEALYTDLRMRFKSDPDLNYYYKMIGRSPLPLAEKKYKILIVTNLFPPQELGGYGRKMWEFANYLISRGHRVQVLTASLPAFSKVPSADEIGLEANVDRILKLKGEWSKIGGASAILDRNVVAKFDKHNRVSVQQAMVKLEPDIMFAGNLDFLGVNVINAALNVGLPVLQALGNMHPGFLVDEQPVNNLYWTGSCSRWNADIIKAQGYNPARVDVIYPGARIDRFFKIILPDRYQLRICFAGLVMPFKGVQTLVQSLALLAHNEVEFMCEIAGDCASPSLLAELIDIAKANNFEDRVKFLGFLDRRQLVDLYARNNILVFPSIVDEGFGISQVEAMAAGLVVISSGTGGAKEIIRDGVDGLLFPAENAVSLAHQMIRLNGDPELFAALQKASQLRSLNFSVTQSGEKIEKLISELVLEKQKI